MKRCVGSGADRVRRRARHAEARGHGARGEVLADQGEEDHGPGLAEDPQEVAVQFVRHVVVPDEGERHVVGQPSVPVEARGSARGGEVLDRVVAQACAVCSGTVGVEDVLGPPLCGHGEDRDLACCRGQVSRGDRLGPVELTLADARCPQQRVERPDERPSSRAAR